MMSVEEFKALKVFLNLGERIEKAKETGIGLYDAGIFTASGTEDGDADDADSCDTEKDESESE